MIRWQIRAAGIASLALAGGLMLSEPSPSLAQQSPTEEGVLNALRPPETERLAAEPLRHSVEEQRFIDRIRTDKTRQLALLKEHPLIANSRGSRPRIDLELYFAYESAEITPRAEPDLMALGKALTNPDLKGNVFLIAAHTDAKGSDKDMQALSERRAAAVKKFLRDKFGIPDETLVTIGYGNERLKNPSEPFAAENRRIEIVNLSDRFQSCRRRPSAAPYC